MFGDLRSVRVRRFLYLSTGLLLVIAVATRVWLGGDGGNRQVARELASNVAGAVMVWTLGIAFLGIFFAKEKQARETRVIDGDASAKQFARVVSDATCWYHHGQIGRWVRENALPALITRSARSPEPLRMIVVLLDPTNHDVCQAHADRRNARRRKESAPFDAKHIKTEVSSTILSLAKATAKIPSFSAQVFVTDLDIPFRIDLCDEYGFITHEDQTAPAFEFERESPYYATTCSYFENFESGKAREINLGAAGEIGDPLTKQSIRRILLALKIDFPESSVTSVTTDVARSVNGAVK